MAEKKLKRRNEMKKHIPNEPKWGYDGTERREDHNIGSGSWVLIKSRIPVDERVRPQTYGIYWAIPHEDRYGRQMVKVYTPEEVCLLNYEYAVISEERLEEYKAMGYHLKECNAKYSEPLNLELLEAGRSLCEEEREIIWALQLDGLTESQACEEYFLSHHTEADNINLCYLPDQETLKEIEAVFGKYGIAG